MVSRHLLFVPFLFAGAAMLLAQTSSKDPKAPAPAWGENPALALVEFGKLYRANCASCHGENLEGGGGPALTPALINARTDDQLHDTIHNGHPEAGMPPFKDILSDAEQWQLVNFLRFKASAPPAGPPAAPIDPAGLVVRSAKQTFKLEVVAGGLDTPWAVAFLPDGRKLITERPGRLRIVEKDGRLLPGAVTGMPTPWVRQDGGYLDVAAHPDYAHNGWIYLSYSEVAPGHIVTAAEAAPPGPGVERAAPPSMTVIVRGKIDRQNRWVDSQVIFRAPISFYTHEGSHYGSRFLFDGHGHLFFSLGERGDMTQAQRLDSPLGKIHRINDDGSVPPDNPFVKTPGAIPTIWSYGHRNPQGLAFDPVTGLLWATEHGPIGGDEVNIIEKGKNYGWGVVSMGSQPGIDKREAPGMAPPITYYTPTIAPSGIAFYTGNRYPAWKNNLFIAGLAGQLRRVEVSGRTITDQEIVFQRLGRTRAVYTGPDGLLYVLVHRYVRPAAGTAPQGWLLRLQPEG
jgi:glucose/arabinose dehydrogenase